MVGSVNNQAPAFTPSVQQRDEQKNPKTDKAQDSQKAQVTAKSSDDEDDDQDNKKLAANNSASQSSAQSGKRGSVINITV